MYASDCSSLLLRRSSKCYSCIWWRHLYPYCKGSQRLVNLNLCLALLKPLKSKLSMDLVITSQFWSYIRLGSGMGIVMKCLLQVCCQGVTFEIFNSILCYRVEQISATTEFLNGSDILLSTTCTCCCASWGIPGCLSFQILFTLLGLSWVLSFLLKDKSLWLILLITGAQGCSTQLPSGGA